MLREGWNFRNDIAIRLEGIARVYYRDIDRPVGKIYDADAIQLGCFAEVMIILLREQSGMHNDREDIDGFVRKCRPYLGMRGDGILDMCIWDAMKLVQKISA